jgi:hypothetical protein
MTSAAGTAMRNQSRGRSIPNLNHPLPSFLAGMLSGYLNRGVRHARRFGSNSGRKEKRLAISYQIGQDIVFSFKRVNTLT